MPATRSRRRVSAQPQTWTGGEYAGPQLLQIAMPMGGLGAGCICLSGYGGLLDYSIHNKPDTTALPDGHSSGPAGFALLHIKGDKPITKLVEGPLPVEKIYDQGLQAQGYRKGGHEGLPRFEKARFRGRYPFGEVTLTDRRVPVEVAITGWSPLIPGDDRASGIPGAILEYTLHNASRKTVTCMLSFHLSHLAIGAGGEAGTRNSVMAGRGILFTNTDARHLATFGSASLSIVGRVPRIKAMWLRVAAWTYGSISALWKEMAEGRFSVNKGNADRPIDGRNGGSVMVELKLRPGQRVTVPFVIAWHFPNVDWTAGQPQPAPAPGALAPGCGCADGKCGAPARPAWQPWYATRWADAAEVAGYVRENFSSLRRRTAAFADALYSSTLPDALLDAVGSNLAILKSPTVLRQASGTLWGWEGCFCQGGCCHGSCTHVWNYAQAIPHLFPKLERTLREVELERCIDESGHVTFRAALPEGPVAHDFHPAADGQLGGILKLYRDWQICGDKKWLARLYPKAKKSIDFCIGRWDPKQQGALFEPHHNTYDIEFWGPDGMCTGIYCAALAAMAAMGEVLGQPGDAQTYRELGRRSADYLERELFNGEFFVQHVMTDQLQAGEQFRTTVAGLEAQGNELAKVLKSEGPMYQYGGGCISDGVIGAWMARLYGVDSPQSRSAVQKHLRSIVRYNFRPDLFEHACTQRPGYALGHEGGLILCTWPHGGKPTLPFIYSDEVWTGIEYQVASHLIAEGMVEEGVRIVASARRRYDGRVRNPFNEYECGNYYARAMSSYALLGAYGGLRYSAASRTLWLDPKTARRPFRVFLSTVGGFGVVTLERGAAKVAMIEGRIRINELRLGQGAKELRVAWKVDVPAARSARIALKTGHRLAL
jgi:uncharacterized protein (DUF608 family)